MELFDHQEDVRNISREPLQVRDNVIFSESDDVYLYPFATKTETTGLLSGSEGWSLCSKGQPIYSRAFVQCGAALVRNRDTGLITLIHESTWSDAADAALALQRNNDLDVITIEGAFSSMDFKNVKYAHEKDPKEVITSLERVDRMKSRKYRPDSGENKALLMDRSALIGLSEKEVDSKINEIRINNKTGQTNLVGEIKIPLSKGETDRWYLLYRPNENIIWVYESKSKKLFKYAGFD